MLRITFSTEMNDAIYIIKTVGETPFMTIDIDSKTLFFVFRRTPYICQVHTDLQDTYNLP